MKSFRYLSAVFVLIPTLSFASPLNYQELEKRLQRIAFMESLEYSLNSYLQSEVDNDNNQIASLRTELAVSEATLSHYRKGVSCAAFVSKVIQHQHDNYICHQKGAQQ